MAGSQEMAPERRAIVAAMQRMGWTAERKRRGKTPVWEFRRSDTGGLWDVVTCRQDALSIAWVAETAMSYGDAPVLLADINAAKANWFAERFYQVLGGQEPQP